MVCLLPVGLQHGLESLYQLGPLFLQLLVPTLQFPHSSLLPGQSEEKTGELTWNKRNQNGMSETSEILTGGGANAEDEGLWRAALTTPRLGSTRRERTRPQRGTPRTST